MRELYALVVIFLILQVLDVLLTEIGISLYGLSYEKNIIMQEIIKQYGRFFAYLLKTLSTVFVLSGIIFLYKRNHKKFSVYLLLFLCLIPLYGILSSIYVLVLT